LSHFAHATTPSRARISAAVLIAALVVLSAVAILQSSVLQWPLGSEVRNLRSHPSHPLSYSWLLVSAIGTVPSLVVSGNNSLFLTNSSVTEPIGGAHITVYATPGTGNPVVIASNYTNADGQQLLRIPPGTYKVSVQSYLANGTAFVTTAPGNTTELDVGVNESVYSCSFFETTNSISTSLIAPWDTMFLNVHSASPIVQNTNESVFLSFESSLPLAPTNASGPPVVFSIPGPQLGVHVISEYSLPSEGTQWLEVHLNSVVNITGITAIDVFTSSFSYTTNEYPTASPNGSSTG
jgi:hypothetical protein